MPRYKDSSAVEHFFAKLEDTPAEPVMHLALRHPDVPYGVALDGWPSEKVVQTVFSQIAELPKNRWHPVSVKINYRKHAVMSVEPHAR